MKKIGLILGVVCLMNSSLVASARGNGIQIAKDGKALTKIILPDKPTKTEVFSSKELQRYLKKITGADLAVVSEKEVSGSGIYIGKTSSGTRAIKTHKLHKKDMDSFLMEAKGKNLILVGNCDRSTLYAVYTFLEKLGCLWLAPGIEEIPKKSNLKISNFSQTEEPAFKYRIIFGFSRDSLRNEWERLCLDWGIKQKLNVEYCYPAPPSTKPSSDYVQERGGFRAINDVHHTRRLLTKELHKKHPEWFALKDGKREWRNHAQPCTTNPEYIDFFAEHIKKFFAARPEIEVFPCTQSDGLAFCECPRCTALDTGEKLKVYNTPEITVRWLTFVNQVAEKVAKEYPDKKLYTLVYNMQTPPDPKKLKPAPNVIMEVCHQTGFLHEYTNKDSSKNVKFLKDLKKWMDMTEGGVQIYDYYPTSGFVQFPYIAYKKIYSDLKTLKKMGVKGFKGQTHPSVMGTYLINQYAICKAMWNPEEKPEVVMAKFFKAMYKESASPVKKFCDCLEEKRDNTQESLTKNMILAYLTRSVIEEAEPYINKAMKAAKSDEIRLRVQVLQDNFLMGKWYSLGKDAFSQYDKTGKLPFLKEAINKFKKIKVLSEEAHKDTFRRNYGINWSSFRLSGRSRYILSHISKWEGMLKNYNLQIPYKEGIKTGVYLGSFGADKIVSALSKVKGINAFLLPRLDENTISSCHVVIISNTGNMADKFNQRAEEIRNWVKKGGRVMLLHDAVGYRSEKAVFPEIGKGKRNPHIKQVEAAKAHPITEDLKIGESFPHGYYDHIAIAPGEGGEIIIKDEKNNAVVVAGKVGKGKVVLNGMITGYGKFVSGKEGEMEPTGGELKILINAVKWLGSK